MAYFDTTYVTIDQLPNSSDIASIHWKGYASSEEFQTGMNKLLEFMQNQPVTKILSDTRDFGVITPSDQQWVIENWLPAALKTGYNRIAIVVPSDVFSQISIDSVMEEAKKEAPVNDRYFDNTDKAIEWLQSKEVTA